MARSQIQYGSEGNDVRELQKILDQNGYDLSEDGIFGGETLYAVKDYQKKNGLGVDGIVGSETWGHLLGGSETNTTTTNPSFKYDDFEHDDFKYDKTFTDKGFSNDDYKESDIVTQAKNALNAQLANKPGTYNSQWQAQLDDTINKILNREKFSYNLNGDALYQQYKDKYIQQGKMAMGDAIGKAQAMTGGYGNSYAQSVGQQQYQAQLQNLNDIVPELYQMAYDMYNQEGQDLYNQYSMLGDRENMDYGRYRDSVSDWLTERDYLTGRHDTERGFDYSKYVDDRNFAYGKYADDRTFNYNQYIDDKNFAYGKYADDRNFAYGKYSDDKNYAYNEHRNAIEDAIKMDEIEYQRELDRAAADQWQKQFDAVYGNKDTSGGSVSTSDIKQMQAIIGVGQDGVWGPKSTAAAGGLSAEEAYKAWQNGTLKKTVEPPKESAQDYADWDYGDWEGYFAGIRNGEGGSKAEAEEELNRMIEAGYIPTRFIAAARRGASGSFGH